MENPGIRKLQLAKQLGVSEVTIKRDMQILHDWIQFEGPQKTGGYSLTEGMKRKLKTGGKI